MKKFLFVLTFLAVMVLAGTAFAASCDVCGSGDVTKVGSGEWCQWDCNACGSRTSRSHNPNSNNSGLVPDSCSGKCTWCGASASRSSHSFTSWEPAGDATCLKDGTEISRCANAQCSAKTTRNAPGSALGHNYMPGVMPPTCTSSGYTRYTCSRCGDNYVVDLAPLTHIYDTWTSNGDGTHTAICAQRRCDNPVTLPCSIISVTMSGKTISLCPVCGYISDADADLDASKNPTATPLDGQELPGRLVVLVDAAPLAFPVSTDAFYLFITSFQDGGKTVDFTGKVQITIDLNEHPFSLPESAYADVQPAQLTGRTCKLFRLEQEEINGQPAEVWHEVNFTLLNGILNFETDQMGTFILTPDTAEAPSVG